MAAALVEGAVLAVWKAGTSSNLMRVADVVSHIRKSTGLAFEPAEIAAVLERLEDRGLVEFGNREHTAFRFADERLRSLDGTLSARMARSAEVRETWIQEIVDVHQIEETEAEQLWSSLNQFLAQIVHTHAAEAAAFLYMTDDLGQVRFFDLLDTRLPSLADLVPEHLLSLARHEFRRFFHSGNPDWISFIAERIEVAFYYHLLSIDPSASELMRDTLGEKTLFLDTNFLYHLLGLDGPARAQLPSTLVTTAEELGFQLVVARETVNEFVRALRHDVRRLDSMGVLTRDAYQDVVAEYDDPDQDFIGAFYRELTSGRVRTLQEFTRKYENLEVIIRDWGIGVDEDVVLTDELSQTDEYEISFEELDSWHRRAKPENSIHHDVVLWRTIRERRGVTDSTPRQTRYWLLTYDRKLTRFAVTYSTGDHLPFCMLATDWIQIVRPFLPRTEDYETSFVSMLDHPDLYVVEGAVPVRHMVESLKRLEQYEAMPKTLAAAVVSDLEFDRRFRAATTSEEEKEVLEVALRGTAAKLSRENQELRSQLERIGRRLDDVTDSEQERAVAVRSVSEERDRLEAALQDAEAELETKEKLRAQDRSRIDEKHAKLEGEIDRLREESRVDRRWLIFLAAMTLYVPVAVVVLWTAWPSLALKQQIFGLLAALGPVAAGLAIPLGRKWLVWLGGLFMAIEALDILMSNW